MSNAPQDLLREYAQLNRKRRSGGVTPLEYQRWLDLRAMLEKTFPGRPPPGSRGTSHMRVDYADDRELRQCVMMNVRPIGLFVNTPFAPDPGTGLRLHVHVLATGRVFESRVSVVSNNVGPDFSTAALGMGLRFATADCELRRHLEEICGVERSPAERQRSA